MYKPSVVKIKIEHGNATDATIEAMLLSNNTVNVKENHNTVINVDTVKACNEADGFDQISWSDNQEDCVKDGVYVVKRKENQLPDLNDNLTQE